MKTGGTMFGRQIASASIEAIVTRADGTVEDLGVIASYKQPWWRRFIGWITLEDLG